MAKVQDDESVMRLVELALSQPPDRREVYLRDACGGDPELFREVWDYVQWNDRMRDFLLEPMVSVFQDRRFDAAGIVDEHATRTMAYRPDAFEHRFHPGDLLLSRFRIVREVAEGGMGIVYEARDEKLGRRIALKCAKSGHRKRLPPEVRHASEISHANVCRIFEIHTASTSEGDMDFFTMEFLEGETLRARLGKGPLPGAETRAIGRQICAGVAEAHRNRVVHGDLKSINVILARDTDGSVRAVVTDFGLARGPLGSPEGGSTGQAGATQAGGTPGYMAPELWKGEKPSIASDVYALGVTLYELIANHRPYPSDLPWQERIEQPLPALHHPWNRIVQRCLDPDPARRFRDAGEVAVALDPPRSRRWWMGAAAAIFLAAATATAAYQRATAPKQSMRLAMLPLESAADTKDVAERVSRDVAAELAQLKGGTRARLSIVPWSDVIGGHADTVEKARTALGATHLVRGTIASENGKVVVHTFLTDAQTQAISGEWSAEYAPGELRYAARATRGMVTFALGLLPPETPMVNAKTMQAYSLGLRYTRRDSTIDSALPLLDSAIRTDPDSPLTWAALAEAQYFKYFVTSDPAWLDRTRASLKQAQDRDPDLAPVHRVAGVLLYKGGFYTRAEIEYQRARELEPFNGENYRRLGQVYERENRLDLSLEAFLQATKRDGNSFRAWQNLGTFYWGRGDFEEAVRKFLICVQLAPDEADAHFALGTMYFEMGRYPEAEEELRRAIGISPTPKALNNLAAALSYDGKDPEAIPVYLLALKASPNEDLQRMALGDAYRRTKREHEAKEAYQQARELAQHELTGNPSDDALRARMAYLRVRLGERAEAESEIGQAVHTTSDYYTLEMAVEVYELLGEHENARTIWETLPYEILLEISRNPDLADLRRNSRFQKLLDSHQVKK